MTTYRIEFRYRFFNPHSILRDFAAWFAWEEAMHFEGEPRSVIGYGVGGSQ